MDHQFRRPINASAAMRSRAGLHRATVPSSPADSMWAPPLKRSRTSLQLPGSTRMYQSHSTPGTSFGTPLALPFNPSFLPPVAEQPGFASVSFTGPQIPASAQPASYFDAGRPSAPVYEDPGMDPNEFLHARGCNPTQPLSVGFPDSSSLPSPTTVYSDLDQLQHHVTASSHLSYSSMTDAMTLDTSSSRQIGNPYDGAAPPFQMVHTSSQSSFGESPVYEGGLYFFDKSSANDADLRYTGSMHPSNLHLAPSAGLNDDFSQAISSYMGRSGSTQSHATVDLAIPVMPQSLVDGFDQQQYMAEDMRRGSSNTSVRSTASSRAKSTLRRQIDNQKTPLQPKVPRNEADNSVNLQQLADVDDLAASAETLIAVSRSSNTAGTRIEAIRTRQGQQPKVSKLFCDICGTSKGFRGDHELRRHKMNKHSSKPKRWICCDPRETGKTSSYEPFQSISSCRKCRDKRPYAQDYNAAEHLRRVHFTPKAHRKGGAGRTKHDSHCDSVGGQRRPEDQMMVPMDELKKWMKEVDLDADAKGSSAANDEDNDEEHGFDAPDNTGDDDRSPASHGQGDSRSTSHGGGAHSTDCGSSYNHGPSDAQYLISPVSAYQSPRISPWCPKGLVSEAMGAQNCSPTLDRISSLSGPRYTNDPTANLFPGIYPYYYEASSPSEEMSMQGSNNLFGCSSDSDFASQSSSFLDPFDQSFHIN